MPENVAAALTGLEIRGAAANVSLFLASFRAVLFIGHNDARVL